MEHQFKCKCKDNKIGKRVAAVWLCPHNNLASFYPKIKIYWSEENESKPEDYTYGSGQKCILKCGDPACDGITIKRIKHLSGRKIFTCTKCTIKWGIIDASEIP